MLPLITNSKQKDLSHIRKAKCLEKYLVNLFKGSQDKFSTADATSKPADEDADVTLINELVSRIIRQRNKVCLRPPTDKTSR
ncbi:unnamed protein product [Rhizophagus irregularis]|nr:unnamed protein product [Rhizophagus irregularis]